MIDPVAGHCKLYRKFNCSRITLPRNSAGNGEERIGGADARNCRSIKGFRPGRNGNHKFRNRSFLADCELNYNLASPPQACAFGHHGQPVLLTADSTRIK